MSTQAAPHSRGGWLVADLALLLLAVALLVLLVLVWDPAAGRDADLDARTAAASTQQRDVTRAAGEMAVAFLEVDHRDMAAVQERVLDGATGDFAEEYAADQDRLASSVERRRAVVEASLRAVGSAAGDDAGADRVVALVAADSLLRDDETGDEGLVRRHRMRLTLVAEGDRWRVSDLEFVR